MPQDREVTFWHEIASRAPALQAGFCEDDRERLKVLIDELTDILVQYDPRLSLLIYAGDPYHLAIRSTPGGEAAAEAFAATGSPPPGWSVGVGLPDDELESVQVQDEVGG